MIGLDGGVAIGWVGWVGWVGWRNHATAEIPLVGKYPARSPHAASGATHFPCVETLARSYREAGWLVELEAAFNEAGERGRIDLLAFHPQAGAVVVGEVKSELANIQELLGRLAAKLRIAPAIARRLGWAPDHIIGLLALASTSRNRRIVAMHPAAFRPFVPASFRGVGTLAHMDRQRMLLWIPADRAGRHRWLAGRRRMRRAKPGTLATRERGG